ncbi:PR domain zinc finger protein 5-like isoform X2 [Harmonia axyridis]|uniref:PR domain zinc finger protein 5-like isoform X2 n=1 Tax=Harmonia axyridis TaxID=115357 RepID=UPI001E27640A|nr:PR domain zinc finger protein 5-like isoform X2 [Harmonia axyridis]
MVLNENEGELSNIVNEEKRICAICGSTSTTSCDCTNVTSHILNRTTATKAQLSLPDGFMVYHLADGTYRVITNKFIKKGTCLGPLEAAKSITLNPAIHFPLKIFPAGEDDFLEYYLDTLNEETSTWMMFIPPAENYEEQNLMCYQEGQCIYYLTVKDIIENEALKVWYSPYYASKMGKKLLEENVVENKPPDAAALNELVKSQQNIPDLDSWTCKFCNININMVTKFAGHLIKEYYSAHRNKTCPACKRNFKTKKCVCEHMKLVEDSSSNKINLAMSRAIEAMLDQNSNREISLGDPLLNSTGCIDQLDNSDLIIPTLSQMNEEDSQILNLNSENLLISEDFDELDYFDFEIEEVKGGIDCDICFKNFSKLPYLIQHLRSHRGDYYCSSCNKVFSRKENLTYHSCNRTFILECSSCNLTFSQKKYYNRHMDAVHEQKYKCNDCNKICMNMHELKYHKCKQKEYQCQFYVCEFCKKLFSNQASLKAHISKKHINERIFMCEYCSKQYSTKFACEMHLRTHDKPQFKCETCHKEFHRKDVLKVHIESVHDDKEFECDICMKKFKSKKNLSKHKNIHTNIEYNCPFCESSFNNKYSLTRHQKVHEKNEEISKPYSCSICNIKMKMKSSLLRHIQKKHNTPKLISQKAPDSVPQKAPEQTKTVQKEDALQFLGDDLDLLTDSQDNIDLINDVDMNELERKHIQVIDNILLKKSEEMGLGVNTYTLNSNDVKSMSSSKLNKDEISCTDRMEQEEVFLTIPDLMDIENDIILETSAFLGKLCGVENRK